MTHFVKKFWNSRFNMHSSDLLVAVAFLLLGSVFFVDFDKVSTLISSNPASSSSNISLLPTET